MPTMDITATLPRVAMTAAPQSRGRPRSVDGTTTVQGGKGIGGHRRGGVG
jgi:hypothetical protein